MASPKSVPIQEVPATLYCCGGCGQPLTGAEYHHPKTTVQFWCKTMKCRYRGIIVELTLPKVYSAPGVGMNEDLCQCERCVPDLDGK